MYIHHSAKTTIVLFVVLVTGFASCVKDNCTKEHQYTFYRPVYKTKADVRSNIKSNAPRAVENPGKLNIRGNYIFLNELDKGIHVIDNSNKSAPRNIAFIDIPGNIDIAVKGNTLYADLYTDMVSLDITDPSNVKLTKVLENLFPHRVYSNGLTYTQNNGMLVTEWLRVDTTVVSDCSNEMAWLSDVRGGAFFSTSSGADKASSGSPIGIGGSMARFTIMDNWLYTVNTNDLDVFSIASANDPVFQKRINIGWGIETIYPFKEKLFVGSRTGMYIYNVTNPASPVAAGQFNHVQSCDPVIADEEYAYVTLRSGSTCQGFINELNIVKLNNFTAPSLEKVYPMKNPHGLSKDGKLLFICDGDAGLKLYNASSVMNLQFIDGVEGIDAFDVIAMNKVALVVAKDGLYQYDYSDPTNLTLISKIGINKK